MVSHCTLLNGLSFGGLSLEKIRGVKSKIDANPNTDNRNIPLPNEKLQ